MTLLLNLVCFTVKVFLPSMPSCRVKFLQQVFVGEKDVVLSDRVPQFVTPSQPELAVKLVFEHISQDHELMKYFDTERVLKGKYPEKKFFWGIMHTVRKELTMKLLEEVMDKRVASGQDIQQEQLRLQPVWIEQLLSYPTPATHGKYSFSSSLDSCTSTGQP